MPRFFYVAAIPTILFFCQGVKAAPDHLIDRAIHEHVYQEPAWLALVHYRRHGENDDWVSEADAASFFLATNGKISPRNELIATLEALSDASGADPALCRFPARYKWLSMRLNFTLPEPQGCPDLKKWRDEFATNNISILFAGTYIKNPASAFGHTFLRFRQSHDDDKNLLTPTVNFAAEADNHGGAISFIYRGLSGGYGGSADTVPLFRRLRTYSDNEGRDIWEYSLDFTVQEIELIALHTWEIKNSVFDYFFLDENCAYRTLAILSVARPELDLTDGYSKYTIPVDTLRTLSGRKLIQKIDYWPAPDKMLKKRSEALTHTERIMARDLATGKIPADNPGLLRLDPRKQSLIRSVSFDYLSMLIARDGIESEKGDSQIRKLIKARAAETATDRSHDILPLPKSPETGHKPGFAAILTGAIDGQNFVQVGLRGAYHDFVDSSEGYDKGISISLLSVEHMFLENKTSRMNRFDLLSIDSRIPASEFFSPAAWSFNISRLRKPIGGELRLVNSIGYRRGQSFEAGGNTLSYLLGINADNGGLFDNRLGMEGLARLEIQRQEGFFSYSLSAERAAYLTGIDSDRFSTGLMAGFSSSPRYRAVLEAKRDRSESGYIDLISLGFRHYF